MGNRKISIIVLSIATVIICLFLNFNVFLMGGLATIKNVVVTFSYIAIWILVLIFSIKSKDRGILVFSSVFWVITLFVGIVTAYVNFTGNSADWILPFVILFLGQWYGIGFFVSSDLTRGIIIALISLVMFIITVISLKRFKSS